jgi:hypothetical protein
MRTLAQKKGVGKEKRTLGKMALLTVVSHHTNIIVDSK